MIRPRQRFNERYGVLLAAGRRDDGNDSAAERLKLVTDSKNKMGYLKQTLSMMVVECEEKLFRDDCNNNGCEVGRTFADGAGCRAKEVVMKISEQVLSRVNRADT